MESTATRPVSEAARALYEQGQLHYHRRGPGDLELAEARYLEAIAQAPTYAEPWVGLASLAHLRIFEGGEQAYQEFARKEREMLQHALQLQPDLAIAHVRLARLLWTIGEPREAVDRHLQQALKYGSDNPLVLGMYGMDLHRRGDVAESLRIAERVVRLDPYSAVYRANLATVYMYHGRLERAEQELETLEALHPGFGLALEYARLRLLQGRPQQALVFLPEIEHEVDRLAIRAMALFAQGSEEGSRVLLEELQAMDNPVADVRYVEARYFMGDSQSTASQLERLRERWSADPALRAELDTAITDLLFTPFSREVDRNATGDDLADLFLED